MTNYNKTDKIIRGKYEAFDPAFDADAMWAELSPMVDQKKRRGFFFWTFSGAVAVMLILVSFSLLKQDVNEYTVAEIVNDNTLDSKDLEDASKINSSLKIDESINVSLNNDENIIEETKVSIVDVSNEEIGNSPIVISTSDTKSVSADNSTKFSLSDQQIFSSPTINDFTHINSSLEVATNMVMKNENIVKESRNLVTYSKLELAKISLLEYTRDGVLKVDSEIIESSYTQPLLKNQWRVGVNGGYYIHSRSFDNVGDNTSDNYKSRSMEEKAKDGYDLGIKIEYFLSDHFVVIGGFRFSQSFVQRKADYTYTEQITLEDHVVAIIITEQGPVEIKEDITYDGVFNHLADNYITATRLGLITGLQYRVGLDRWTTHVDLGVELPIWNSHSGFITNNGRPYNLSDGTEVINASSLQLFGGIGMEYSLSKTTALQATIGGYMPLKNEHAESYAIEKKSSLLGLNLGVHFRL